MLVSSQYFIFINAFIVLIYVVFAAVGYKNGLIYEGLNLLISVIGIIIAWITAPILAKHFLLFELSDLVFELFDVNYYLHLLIYFVLVFLLVRLLYFLISPLLKKLCDLPVLGFLNRLGGLLVACLNATFVVLLLSLLLNTPLFSNGNEIASNTFFKPIKQYSSKLTALIIEKAVEINLDQYGDFSINECSKQLEEWLIKEGLIHE